MLTEKQLDLIDKALGAGMYRDLAEASQRCSRILPTEMMFSDLKSKKVLTDDLTALKTAYDMVSGAKNALEEVPETTVEKANYLKRYEAVYRILEYWRYLLIDNNFLRCIDVNTFQQAILKAAIAQVIGWWTELGMSIDWSYVYWDENDSQYKPWDVWEEEVNPDRHHSERLESQGKFYYLKQTRQRQKA
ncbi:hypothetical protein ACE1B6_24060 [Aerosakkonemataceae cyanobacterium BLCC-F154]|uniref:Uncharacterized protein n=1 Tax=Floridaenema fluviatile BLCC-F154 TaxID=3153640 RepID=A0ABV4YII4_9CYAN